MSSDPPSTSEHGIPPPTPKPNAEEIARKFGDIAELIKLTNDDIAKTRTELFFFITFLSFVFLTVCSITDRDILVGAYIRLPALSVSINLLVFVLTAPLIVISVHLPLILKYGILRDKCKKLRHDIAQLNSVNTELADELFLHVTSNFLTQTMIYREKWNPYRILSALIYVIILFFFPIIVILFLTVRTLPFHDVRLNAAQIIFLLLDISLLCQFHYLGRRRILFSASLSTLLGCALALVFCVPGSWSDRIGIWVLPTTVPLGSKTAKRTAFWPTAALLESSVSETTGRPYLWFSRNLVDIDDRAPAQETQGSNNRQEQLKGSDASSVHPSVGFSLRGRDLRFALLDRTNLKNVDLTAAKSRRREP